jgi:hypothetical protein
MAVYANHMHTPTAIRFAMANVILNPTTWCSDEVMMDPFEGLSPFQFGPASAISFMNDECSQLI